MHRGEITEKIIKDSGYSFINLAKKLDISRNTLYNRLQNSDLGYQFIIEIGNAIYYDFSIIFPDMKEQVVKNPFTTNNTLPHEEGDYIVCCLERKYIKLLETYTRLLTILIKIANHNQMHQLKNQVIHLMERSRAIKSK